ncbi:MAG: acetylxylan esterase [Bryobacterales bacterium]|nr:acetylxylan esterase [Bryobacterales bacterium]
MQRRGFSALLAVCLIVPGAIVAQVPPDLPDWNVFYGNKDFADPEGMFARYLRKLRQEEERRRSQVIAGVSSRDSLRRYQDETRAALRAALGDLPDRTPLNARTAGVLERDGYAVEKVIFESRPRYYVTANVYVPRKGTGPYPAVLAAVGHWGMGKTFEEYQRLGIYLARRGYIVLVYDVPGQGERREYFNPIMNRALIDPGGSHWFVTLEHGYAGGQAILTGGNYASYLVWDGVRALDYLTERPDVDASRLACTGTSGGGLQTELLSAFDDRIKISIPVCYGGCNPDNPTRPGLSIKDVDALIAPRPLLMIEATGDPRSSVLAKQERHEEIAHLYKVAGENERTKYIVVEGPHGYVPGMYEAAYVWMERWFFGRQTPRESLEEPATPLEPAENLHCTPSGEVTMSLGGETVASLNRTHAGRLARARAAGDRREAIRHALALDLAPRPLRPKTIARAERGSFILEKIAYWSDDEVFVPGLLLLPPKPGRHPAVVFVNEDGKATQPLVEQYLKPLVEAGVAVLTIDPRGMGETDPETPRSSRPADFKRFVHGVESGFFYDSMRVGQTVPGMRTRDIFGAVDYLAGRSEVDPARISAIGHGSGGLLVLFAAAFDPRIQTVAATGSLVSYQEIAANDLYTHQFGSFGPGFLRVFDLPDVVALITPRRVLLNNLVDAQHRVLMPERVRRTYAAEHGKLEIGHTVTAQETVRKYLTLLARR